jgi:hypothetical protein
MAFNSKAKNTPGQARGSALFSALFKAEDALLQNKGSSGADAHDRRTGRNGAIISETGWRELGQNGGCADSMVGNTRDPRHS